MGRGRYRLKRKGLKQQQLLEADSNRSPLGTGIPLLYPILTLKSPNVQIAHWDSLNMSVTPEALPDPGELLLIPASCPRLLLLLS